MTAADVIAGPKVTALAPWFGAKRTMAKTVIAEFGPHRAYWEPFCGSMAVLLAKPEASHETVNDLHGDLVNLAWVLQSPRWAELYDRCARSFITEVVFRHAAAQVKAGPWTPDAIDDAAVDRAYWFFIRSWWGRNGIVGAKGVGDSLAVRFTPGGGHGGIRFRSCVESMPWWHERLLSVVVLNRDAFKLIEAIEDVPGVVIYCDPPYIVKGAQYVHDFAGGDHARLAGLLLKFQKARVVVSYYAHPDLEALYPGWRVVECNQTKSMVNQGMRSKKGITNAPEVLIVNHPDESLFRVT